jgi:hypothetical protein
MIGVTIDLKCEYCGEEKSFGWKQCFNSIYYLNAGIAMNFAKREAWNYGWLSRVKKSKGNIADEDTWSCPKCQRIYTTIKEELDGSQCKSAPEV